MEGFRKSDMKKGRKIVVMKTGKKEEYKKY